MAISVKGSLLPSGLDTPLNERSRINTRSELSSIPNPSVGETVYIKDEKKTYQIDSLAFDADMGVYYITEENISPLGGGADVYFSENGIAPENINTIWVDGADNQQIDSSTFDRIRTELNKLDNRLSNIEYAFDVKLDSGDTTYYKGSELVTIPGVSPETQFDLVLSFTYDGSVFTFEKNPYDGSDIRNVGTNIEFKLNDKVVTAIEWTNSRVSFNSDHTKCSISSMDYLDFDKFTIYNGTTVVYQAELSAESLMAEEPTWANKLQPNVHHICIKRAPTEASLNDYKPQDGELIYSMSTNQLYIGNSGRLGVISGGSGSGNVTAHYIDLYGPDGTTQYRVTIDENGQLVAKLKEDDSTPGQSAGAAGTTNLPGLKISMVYAGPAGATATSSNSCSHSFIELYNASAAAINLKGVSLCIGVTGWDKVIPLKGSIAAGSCYLIRLNPVSNPTNASTKIVIDKYDLDAYETSGASIDSKGFKLYLQIGHSAPSIANPYSPSKGDADSTVIGYIDLVGVNGKTTSANVNAGETQTGQAVHAAIDANVGIFRQLLGDPNASTAAADKALSSSGDTNNNEADFRSMDYSSNISPITGLEMWDIDDFKPYYSGDGKKNLYFYKHKFNSSKPCMPTISIGELPSTRRFNWISTNPKTTIEKLYYRISGQTSWTEVQSHNTDDGSVYKDIVVNDSEDGVSYVVRKAEVTGLTTGSSNSVVYEWCVGNIDSDYISDIYTFTVTKQSLDLNKGSFRFCQVSDQQGWTFGEYEPWNLTWKKIVEKFNNNNFTHFPHSAEEGKQGIEFVLNTGDMTQNGLRPSEWIDYYTCGTGLANVAQMNCVGNNDLCPGVDENGVPNKKINPTTFIYFYNYEYSNDSEEQALQKDNNGEFMKSVYAFDYGCAHFICLNSNNYIDELKKWFKKHMDNVKARPDNGGVLPKWFIVYVHDAPFNIMTKSPSITDNENLYVGLESNIAAGLRDTKMNQRNNGQKAFEWSRLFEEYGIDVVLSGHKHTYSRTYPLIENTTDPNLSEPTINKNNFAVNPWSPLTNKETTALGGVNTSVQVGEETKKGVVYVMSQATGFKLQSNKDIPAPQIDWLAHYFPGQFNDGKFEVNSTQKSPTFIIWDITDTELSMNAYQVPYVTTGAYWDSLNGGDSDTNLTNAVIDTPFDSFKILK